MYIEWHTDSQTGHYPDGNRSHSDLCQLHQQAMVQISTTLLDPGETTINSRGAHHIQSAILLCDRLLGWSMVPPKK